MSGTKKGTELNQAPGGQQEEVAGGGESGRCRSHSCTVRLLLPMPKVPRMPKGKEGFPCQK